MSDSRRRMNDVTGFARCNRFDMPRICMRRPRIPSHSRARGMTFSGPPRRNARLSAALHLSPDMPA